MSKNALPVFLSCIVSSLTFRSLIHFELIFMYGVREHTLHKQCLGFLQPLLVPLIVKSTKGNCPPNVGTQDWDTQHVTSPLSPQGRSLGNPLPCLHTGPSLFTSLLLPPDSMWIFLTALLVQEFPGSFQ